MLPRVSVLTPIYNQEKYIKECVESVLSQDYENLEVIVVDDGSTDATPEILKRFGPSIRYIRQENRGTAAALNVALRAARGSLVAWLSADDVYLPGKIHEQVQKIQNEPDLALVYTDWIMIDSEGRELKTVRVACPSPKWFIREMLKGNFINGSSVLVKKKCFEEIGYFNENLPASADGDMWFRLLKHGYRFGHIPKLLLKYRWHPSNLSHKFRLMQACRDQVYLKAIEKFSAKELFGDLVDNDTFQIGIEYERIAMTLTRGLNFRAAKAALRKASQADRSSPTRILLSGVLSVMDTEVVLTLLSCIRKVRQKSPKFQQHKLLRGQAGS